MPDVKVDLRELSKFARELEQIAKKAMPYAMRNTLNSAAFEARSEFNKQIGKQTTLRSTHLTRGTVVDKATLSTMKATVGNIRPYVAGLEEGRTNHPHRGAHVAVPLRPAAGQSGVGKRTKLVRRPNMMSAIHLPSRVGRSPRQQNAVAIRTAAAGNHFAYLAFGETKGIYRVSGGANGKRPRLVKLWDLSHASTKVAARPTMEATLRAITPRLPAIAEKALMDQLRRHGVR
ncbi:MAG: hypothetical protein JWN04_3843 [Myxococcaceae bacterium]|nr:hypothetical protein [Myxococcaceae bacterium]